MAAVSDERLTVLATGQSSYTAWLLWSALRGRTRAARCQSPTSMGQMIKDAQNPGQVSQDQAEPEHGKYANPMTAEPGNAQRLGSRKTPYLTYTDHHT